jgi:hypothetical protein
MTPSVPIKTPNASQSTSPRPTAPPTSDVIRSGRWGQAKVIPPSNPVALPARDQEATFTVDNGLQKTTFIVPRGIPCSVVVLKDATVIRFPESPSVVVEPKTVGQKPIEATKLIAMPQPERKPDLSNRVTHHSGIIEICSMRLAALYLFVKHLWKWVVSMN